MRSRRPSTSLHILLHPNNTLQRHLRALHSLPRPGAGVLHILHPPYGGQRSRLFIHLEFARLRLHGAQDGVEGVATEERVLLVRDERADESALPAIAG